MTSTAEHTPAQAQGALAATLCYFLWGLVPLYWRLLVSVHPVELIAHRHIWSLLLLLAIVALQRGFGAIGRALNSWQSFAWNGLGAMLLTTNWLVYVWGVNTGHVIETSLGYFLVPLVNIATGRFILHEHMRRAQWFAIGLAVAGVVWMIVQLGRPPWIALILAATWGSYSLLRKRSPLPAVTGLAIETLLLTPIAVIYLLWRQHAGVGTLGHADFRTQFLLILSGVVTAIPLLLFAYGARRIRLSTLGLLQYLAPTVQFMLGIWFFHEPFSRARTLGFGFIWAALAIYTVDNLLAQRRLRVA